MSHRHHKDDCCVEKKCFVKKCCWEPYDPCCNNYSSSFSSLCGSGTGSGFGGLGIIIFIIIILCLCGGGRGKW